jgi:hypothetical protein
MQSDKFEVTLDLICRSGKIILPEDIYDCDGAVIIPVPLLQVHLRTHESLMRAYTASIARRVRTNGLFLFG